MFGKAKGESEPEEPDMFDEAIKAANAHEGDKRRSEMWKAGRNDKPKNEEDVFDEAMAAANRREGDKRKSAADYEGDQPKIGEDILDTAMRSARERGEADRKERLKREDWTKKAREANRRRELRDKLVEQYAKAGELSDDDVEELKEMDMITIDELMTDMDAVKEQLDIMRELAMGSGKRVPSRETQEELGKLQEQYYRVGALFFNQFNAAEEAFFALGRGETVLVPKPENYEELVKVEPLRIVEETEAPPDKAKWVQRDTELREGIETAERALAEVIDDVNANLALANQAKTPELRYAAIGYLILEGPKLQEQMRSQIEALNQQHEELRDVERNLGLAARHEGKEAA